jgi:cyclophilin family peptidyl-prolyl cis-trans isomerase
MQKHLIYILLIPILFSCNKYKDDSHLIKIQTEQGEITIKLYNQTPIHRDNIVKLSSEKFYDGQIFHRIIQNFVVQGGDPTTKHAQPDTLYGDADSGYLLDAEIVDSLIHKRGALGMARDGDDVNPEKKSSGSQFYIVTGKIFTNQQLDELETKLNSKKKVNLYKSLIEKALLSKKKSAKIDTISISLEVSSKIDSIWETIPKLKFTQKQRSVYTTIGGIPHLDGNYTVFGEVIKGIEVADKLSSVSTDKNDRPLKDIKFSIIVLK